MSIPRLVTLLLICNLVSMVGTATGTEPTGFTVQGFLSDSGSPMTGNVDLEAELWDSATGGLQIGPTVNLAGVPVADGRFEVELDFGDVFTGVPAWLELRARPSGGGSLATLEPRRRVYSTPHVAHAHRVVVADLALNAATLNGFGPDDLVDWTQMTGIPTDLADGDDDTLGGLVCTDGQVARWNGSAWSCADDAGQIFGRTFIVGRVGDPVANGSALLAAMAAIPTPASAADAWLLKIEPGRYDLGTQNLQMKSRVDVEGSGRSSTVITSSACSTGYPMVLGATAIGAADTEIRRLTIENLCSDPLGFGYAVYSEADGLSLSEVLLRAIGTAAVNVGISSMSDRLSISDSVIRAVGAEVAAGIEVKTQGGLKLRNVIAEGSGTPRSLGAWIIVSPGGTGLGFAVMIEGCTFRASNTVSSQGSYGLYIENDTTLEVVVTDSVANASGPSIYAGGAVMWAEGGVTRVTRLRAHGNTWGITFGANSSIQSQAIFTDVSSSADWHGIQLSADVSALVTINGGHIQGGTGSVGDGGSAGVVAHISHAGLVGPTSLSSLSSTCTAVTDGTPTFYASTCP